MDPASFPKRPSLTDRFKSADHFAQRAPMADQQAVIHAALELLVYLLLHRRHATNSTCAETNGRPNPSRPENHAKALDRLFVGRLCGPSPQNNGVDLQLR